MKIYKPKFGFFLLLILGFLKPNIKNLLLPAPSVLTRRQIMARIDVTCLFVYVIHQSTSRKRFTISQEKHNVVKQYNDNGVLFTACAEKPPDPLCLCTPMTF